MYQSFARDPYNTYYYTTMNKSPDGCQSPEFRARSQTWGGNEVGYRERLQETSPSQQYTCYDSANNSGTCNVNENTDTTSELLQSKGNVVKKTSRKNPWGQETYADLIESAINAYPTKMATLQQIYDHISKNYKYFLERSDAASSAGWKNSIRHNLSLHDKFLKCPKKNENMKSSLWSINQNSFKRSRSNSMDCKKSGLELLAKRKQLKEHRRSSANISNTLSEPKRAGSSRSPKSDNVTKLDNYAISTVSKEELLVEQIHEFVDMDTDLRYIPPDISTIHADYNLHEDLRKLGMNSMDPIFNYEEEGLNSSQIPNFHLAAMEYSKFVAELFVDDIE